MMRLAQLEFTYSDFGFQTGKLYFMKLKVRGFVNRTDRGVVIIHSFKRFTLDVHYQKDVGSRKRLRYLIILLMVLQFLKLKFTWGRNGKLWCKLGLNYNLKNLNC